MSWSKQDCMDFLLGIKESNKFYSMDNNVFRIDIKPSDNDLFEITLYQHGEELPPERLAMPDLEYEWEGKKYSISFDVKHFPHKAIIPYQDSRFQNQYWAENFKTKSGNFAIFHGNQAYLSIEEACDMLRYCHSVSNLLAFV